MHTNLHSSRSRVTFAPRDKSERNAVRYLNHTSVLFLVLCSASVHAQSADSTVCTYRIPQGSPVFADARASLAYTLSLLSKPERSDLFRASSLPKQVCSDQYAFLQRWSVKTNYDVIDILPLQTYSLYQSAYPRSVNDGAAWHGVGWNLAATAGIQARWRFFSARVAPEQYYQQNTEFRRVANAEPTLSEFANSFHADIDYPARFGNDGFTTSSLGQSYVQAEAGPVSATFGRENLWLGSARSYPILLSYTAPGFTHLRLGTQRPISLPFVNVEAHLLFGSVRESDFFDNQDANDDHLFTTSMIVLQPKFLPELFLGVARSFHDSASVKGQNLSFFTSRIIETPFGASAGGNDAGNAAGLLLLRFVLPESGFEAYAEWSREDTPGGWVDVLRQPDWTQAYVLGFAKAMIYDNRLFRVYGELTHLAESAASRSGRGYFSYYTHHIVRQGHTNDGQILGAAIGPGSNAQSLGVEFFDANARTDVRLERVRFDDDVYYRTFALRYGETRHDTEFTVSANRTQLIGPIDLEAGIAFSRRYNRDFLGLAQDENAFVENNWRLRLGGTWYVQR
jgi:hypothetical protein